MHLGILTRHVCPPSVLPVCDWWRIRQLLGAVVLPVVVVIVLVMVLLAPAALAQPDSVRAEILRERGYPENHSPRGALWRAAALPGWGQVYNRQYLKLPFVYGGLGGLTYYAIRNHDRYVLHRRANQFVVGRNDNPDGENPFAQYEAQYNEVIDRFGQEVSAQVIRQQRDAYQRQRNLTIIGTGVFYALTIVDAYVSAHLLTFDVGEGLSMDLGPGAMQPSVQATMRIRL